MTDKSKANGGIARAKSLTPAQRSEIAKLGAMARWGKLKATHTGELSIGDITLLCHVLESGERVISGNAIQKSLGFAKNASGTTLKKFIDSRLLPYLTDETKDRLNNPMVFSRVGGVGAIPETHGYDASVLIDICNAIILAERNGGLTPGQKRQAEFADIIIRSVAKVGLVALIDEATGYQEIRDKKALQAILDKYLAKELAAWAKRFPDEFYKEIFRLKGWDFNPEKVARPGVVGRYTIDLVYERLAPGLLKELEQLNPKSDKGYRKHKHHQWLSSDVGHPALSQHIHSIIGFMRISDNWEQLIGFVDKAYPKKGAQIELMFEDGW
ncbi:P63C domain-containing protein [Moraxella bovis]|nr:P63C domain-containing protein [Moraxella bovis]UYZ69131.1 P63C domain-containing protein [Moraxella bovis]UYZ71504.1 P63C domain-containing protein [Moraxella bovis]UYZ72582.1 P63C domain-containing protein [Moraxella bovis]UYZ88772.1 P63C domain-containing protein [Moraxella bovis]UZA14799.1 P63C domain-containing protein [Moraxella bovis]